MKKRYGTKRSALGLIASGVASISIGQKMPDYRASLSGNGLERDGKAVAQDAYRAYRKAGEREYA